MRHDNIRDFLAALISKTQNDVQTEPPLQKISVDAVPNEIGNSTDEARLDIRAKGFWRAGQDAFFDVRVTNPLSASTMKVPLDKIYDKHEKEKKRAYNHRIMTVEHGTFTPLIFSIFGRPGPEGQIFFKKLCSKIADKEKEDNEGLTTWIRTKLSFMCIRACLMCLRGSRVKWGDVGLSYVSDDFKTDGCDAGLN